MKGSVSVSVSRTGQADRFFVPSSLNHSSLGFEWHGDSEWPEQEPNREVANIHRLAGISKRNVGWYINGRGSFSTRRAVSVEGYILTRSDQMVEMSDSEHATDSR